MTWWRSLSLSSIVLVGGLAIVSIHLAGLYISRELGIALHVLVLGGVFWLFWQAWKARHTEIGLRRSIYTGLMAYVTWESLLIFLERIRVIKDRASMWWLLVEAGLLAYIIWAWFKLARLHKAGCSASSPEKKDHGQVP